LKTRAVLFDLGGTLVEICDGPKTFRRVLRSMGTARRESVIEQAILDTEKRLKAEGFMEKFGKIPCAEFWGRYDSSVLERLGIVGSSQKSREIPWRRDQGVLLYHGTVRFRCDMRSSKR